MDSEQSKQHAIRARELILDKYANIKIRSYRNTGYLPSLPWKKTSKLTFHECALWNNVHLSYLINTYQLMICKGLDTEPDRDMGILYSRLNTAVNTIECPLVDYAKWIKKHSNDLFVHFMDMSTCHDMIKNKVVNIFEIAGRKVKGLLCNDLTALRNHAEAVSRRLHKLGDMDNLQNDKIPLFTSEHKGFPNKKALVLAYYSWGRAQGISMDFETYYQYYPKE